MMGSEPEHLQEIGRYFDEYADRQPSRQSTALDFDASQCIDALHLKPGHRFLDIGSGLGGTTCRVGALNTSIQAVGIDLSIAMVEKARLAGSNQPNVRFIHAVFPLPMLKAKAFDSILSIDTFNLMFELQWALVSTIRLLRPGGLFLCASTGRIDIPSAIQVQTLGVDKWVLECRDVGFEFVKRIDQSDSSVPGRFALLFRGPENT
jgi:ubiquinone/menaquinone biosynthesis C-methylase UbiE